MPLPACNEWSWLLRQDVFTLLDGDCEQASTAGTELTGRDRADESPGPGGHRARVGAATIAA